MAVAHGSPIIYTISCFGTGALGDQSFTNAALTLTSTADTTDITLDSQERFFTVPNASMTVLVDGFDLATITVPTLTVSVRTYYFPLGKDPAVGGMGHVDGTGIAAVYSDAFDSYNLSTSFGPVEGDTRGSGIRTTMTTLGEFSFFSFSDGTFTAQLIPEPSLFAGMAISAVILGSRRSRRLCA